MVSRSLRDWVTKISHAKFAYNQAPSYAPSYSLFKVCYGLNPLTLIDVIPILKE